jgi:glycosyltransferase involved in cell wall biosynthesis
MQVSIITVVFNNAQTLEDTILSVQAQQYPDIEYIIIDGGSNDGSLDIIKRYYPTVVSKFISEKDNGIYDAMNKGIALASGEVIAFLNADDLYAHNQVVSRVVQAIGFSGAEVAYGDLQYVQAEDINEVVRLWKAGNYAPNAFLYGWMPPHPTFFAKKKLFNDYGVFNTTLVSAADYELMLRFCFRYGATMTYVPEVLVKMRVGGISNATMNNRLRANNEDRIAWELNGLTPLPYTLLLKPLRKIPQFLCCLQN